MLKNLRKILYTTAFIYFLALCPTVNAQNDLIALESITPEQMKLIQKDIKVNDLDIEPINTQGVKKNVVPDTKKEGKKVFAYFLRAMLAVAFSAIILYHVLIFVRKYYGSAFMNLNEEEDYEALDLTTPDTKQDALKTFLNRSK